MPAPLPLNFRQKEDVTKFYQFLEKDFLSYDGDDDQYDLVELRLELLKQKEPTFSFPELKQLIEIHKDSAKKYVECPLLKAKVAELVRAILPKN